MNIHVSPVVRFRDVSVEGQWTITVMSPISPPMISLLVIERRDGKLTGNQSGEGVITPLEKVEVDGNSIVWTNQITKPLKLKLEFSGSINGNSMTGKVSTGFMGSFPFTGVKAGG